MNFSFLSILLLFVCSPHTLGFTTDIFYIETVIADSVLFVDTGNFKAFADVYTKDLIFNGTSLGFPVLNNSQLLITATIELFPTHYVLQDAITLQRIYFDGCTDKDYTFTKASAITYLTSTFFGSGNLTGQVAVIYLRVDDKLVKTSQPVYGGWRIFERTLSAFVSLPLFFSPCLSNHLPINETMRFCFQNSHHLPLSNFFFQGTSGNLGILPAGLHP